MEQTNRKILAHTSVILLAVLLAGCDLPWRFPQPTPDPKLPDAQQVILPLASGPNAGDLDTLDPALIQFGFNYGLAQLIFPQLVTLDDHLQPIDWAAESHEISADGLTYTFHLRKGMTWANGTPIDATTFAYSINRTLDPCTGASPDLVALHLYDLAGAGAFNKGTCPTGAIKSAATLIGTTIQTPDPLTLRLTLAYPAGYFLSALTWPLRRQSLPARHLEPHADQPGEPWKPPLCAQRALLGQEAAAASHRVRVVLRRGSGVEHLRAGHRGRQYGSGGAARDGSGHERSHGAANADLGHLLSWPQLAARPL
jgi:ABC-type transport system substrate-binding protein